MDRATPWESACAGPTIVARGTDEQRERFLRPIFTAEEIWCQLFSEPGAGSDVAGLATRAVLDGDEWVVNGSKIWTSMAHQAKWGLLLARTDPDVPKHKGLTAFIIDMHQPEVDVRPIRSMAGASGFNEVFFTDAKVPDSMRVGDVGDGWRVGQRHAHERAGVDRQRGRAAGLGPDRRRGRRRGSGAREPDTRSAASRLIKLWIDAELLRLGSLRAQAKREKGVPGPEGSVLKLLSGRVLTGVSEMVVDAHGRRRDAVQPVHARAGRRARGQRAAIPCCRSWARRAATIAGGTTEIQKNIVGERVLGLPREPGFDPNTPWSEIPRN